MRTIKRQKKTRDLFQDEFEEDRARLLEAGVTPKDADLVIDVLEMFDGTILGVRRA